MAAPRTDPIAVRAAELGRASVVLLDGRSGSGKTSWAAELLARFRATGRSPQLLQVEDLYPGWDGLAAGSAAVARVLAEGEYRRYDWIAGAFAETRPIDHRRPLVIEGCGAITAENLRAAEDWAERRAAADRPGDLDAAARDADPRGGDARRVEGSGSGTPDEGGRGRVRALWLDCPDALRRERALARDGDTFAPHWERWAAQERAHFGRHEPWRLADERIPCGG